MSNFILSASDRKRKKTKLNRYTIQRNKTKSIDRLSYRTYSLNPMWQITSILTVQQIEQASNVTKSIRTTEKVC